MRLTTSVVILLLSATVLGADFAVERSGSGWSLLTSGRRVLTYHAPPDGPKPFIDPLCTPGGHTVTTNRSGQPHHHGLWFTWGGVRLYETGETVDFWNDGQGAIVPASGPRGEVGEGLACLTMANEWRRRSDGLVLLREERKVILHDSGTPRAHLITLITDQRAVRPLSLSHESNERVSYYGLALQTPADMRQGLVTNRRRGVGRSGIEGVGAPWCAYSTDVAPPRTVVLFDHPSNPRHPNAWFTLESGFLSTSLVAHDDWFMRAGDRLRLCYGILVADGGFDRPFVSRLYDRWDGIVDRHQFRAIGRPGIGACP